MTNYKKILIIRLSSLGDIILTSPIIRKIKLLNPQIQIDFLIKKEFIQAAEYNPNLTKIIPYSTELSISDYDLVIDFQNNRRSRKLLRSVKCPILRFDKLHLKKFLLVYFKFNLLKNYKSIVERYFDTANLKVENKNELTPEIFYQKEYLDKANAFIINYNLQNEKIIGIAPGAKHFTKKYPKEKYKEIIELLLKNSMKVFLFGGIYEKELCQSLVLNENVYNFQNDNDLYETAAYMQQCSIILTNDSSLMHLADALGKTTVVIFGSSVKEFGFAPQNTNSIIIEEEINCRPCSHIGKSKCPKKHFNCMMKISPDYVFSKIKNLL